MAQAQAGCAGSPGGHRIDAYEGRHSDHSEPPKVFLQWPSAATATTPIAATLPPRGWRGEEGQGLQSLSGRHMVFLLYTLVSVGVIASPAESITPPCWVPLPHGRSREHHTLEPFGQAHP